MAAMSGKDPPRPSHARNRQEQFMKICVGCCNHMRGSTTKLSGCECAGRDVQDGSIKTNALLQHSVLNYSHGDSLNLLRAEMASPLLLQE